MTEPDNFEARSNIMWCATMALNGWTSVGLGKVDFPMHMIEHSLSALYDLPHGAGLSIIVPAWMKWAIPAKSKKLAQFAERVFDVTSGSVETKAVAGIKKLESWFKSLQCPTKLSHCSIMPSEITPLAEHSQTQAKLWRLKEYNTKIIEEILFLAL